MISYLISSGEFDFLSQYLNANVFNQLKNPDSLIIPSSKKPPALIIKTWARNLRWAFYRDSGYVPRIPTRLQMLSGSRGLGGGTHREIFWWGFIIHAPHVGEREELGDLIRAWNFLSKKSGKNLLLNELLGGKSSGWIFSIRKGNRKFWLC